MQNGILRSPRPSKQVARALIASMLWPPESLGSPSAAAAASGAVDARMWAEVGAVRRRYSTEGQMLHRRAKPVAPLRLKTLPKEVVLRATAKATPPTSRVRTQCIATGLSLPATCCIISTDCLLLTMGNLTMLSWRAGPAPEACELPSAALAGWELLAALVLALRGSASLLWRCKDTTFSTEVSCGALRLPKYRCRHMSTQPDNVPLIGCTSRG
mmetsp:Transcript_117385/g.191066  ORF Transcript_117385/g.191066 Transcript_117385/m.191066 type:complete len:214 (-) Transcript_117385:869-1510(-)